LNQVKEIVRVYNWAAIINIAFPAPAAEAGVAQAAPPLINLVTNYGQITFAQVQAHATVYMALQQRASQQFRNVIYVFEQFH
jgi:hypothetical protein